MARYTAGQPLLPPVPADTASLPPAMIAASVQ